MNETPNNAAKRPFQFSLRQLLIAVTVFSVLLGLGRWYYINYVYATPLTPKDDLADYVGRRVAFAGKYELYGKGEPAEFVYLGNERIGFYGPDGPLPPDGKVISVTGRLISADRGANRSGTIRYHLQDATWHK